MKTIIFIIIISFTISSCDTFDVEKNGNNIDGIPFNVKVPKNKRTTQYTRTWLEITMVLLNRETDTTYKEIGTFKFNIKESDWTVEKRNKFLESYQPTIKDDDNTISQILEKQCNITTFDQGELLNELNIKNTNLNFLTERLVKNEEEVVIVYDTNPYYYDVQAPFIGTVNATLKLASDGTLTEATAAIDNTKPADVFIDLVKETFSFAKSLKDQKELRLDLLKDYKIKFFVEQRGYYYTLTKIDSESSDVLEIKDAKEKRYNILVTKIESSEKKEVTKNNENTIKVSGEVVLPKSK